jgi:uncharacterized protein (UPF0261 family)
VATIALVGTLDTKGSEYAFLRERLRESGVDVLIIDAGINEPIGLEADVSREEVARAAGADAAALAAAGDRGAAVTAMAVGAEAIVRELYAARRFDGILALGGSGGSSIAAPAMRALPVGVPKLLVSTVASGDTRANAAGAIAGMVKATVPTAAGKPLVAATMFGVTTPCVTTARERLEELGYEVLVFHATGAGGQSMEALAKDGFLAGVLDVTTTELADELVGGVLSAGPDRLEAAGAAGVPQVVSLGALDMVNFGPRESVPPQFDDRNLYVHNPTVTLMRTTPEECAELGRTIGRKLSEATGPTVLFIPHGGVSMIATPGQPFHDAAADEALVAGLRETLGDSVEVHERSEDVNDPAFATAMADRLHELIQAAAR